MANKFLGSQFNALKNLSGKAKMAGKQKQQWEQSDDSVRPRVLPKQLVEKLFGSTKQNNANTGNAEEWELTQGEVLGARRTGNQAPDPGHTEWNQPGEGGSDYGTGDFYTGPQGEEEVALGCYNVLGQCIPCEGNMMNCVSACGSCTPGGSAMPPPDVPNR